MATDLLLILAGVALFATVGASFSVQREVEPELFRRNFPGLARRHPRLAEGWGRAYAWIGTIVGVLLGTAAIVYGVVGLL
jgi:hypothetical protein